MTPAQCRAARTLLGLSVADLSAAAAISTTTIVFFENNRRRANPGTVRLLRQELEKRGIEFVDVSTSEDCAPFVEIKLGDGSIVRLKQRA